MFKTLQIEFWRAFLTRLEFEVQRQSTKMLPVSAKKQSIALNWCFPSSETKVLQHWLSSSKLSILENRDQEQRVYKKNTERKWPFQKLVPSRKACELHEKEQQFVVFRLFRSRIFLSTVQLRNNRQASSAQSISCQGQAFFLFSPKGLGGRDVHNPPPHLQTCFFLKS